MKAHRHKALVGIVISDRSLLVAEVVSGDKPEVRQLGEVAIGGWLGGESVGAGKALGEFLKTKGISTKAAMIGLPARHLLVKAKEVPPADRATLNDMLRLQAEGEFAADLKDLVYDYQGQAQSTSVLLVATPKTALDAALAICKEAGLKVVGVTSSAMALSEVTGREISDTGLVLSVGAGGSELTARGEKGTTALKHLRGSEQEKAFLGELKRAVVPLIQDGKVREMVVWNGVASRGDHLGIGTSVGVKVLSPRLSELGVKMTGPTEVDGKFAGPVAVALAGMSGDEGAVDFVHTKLAPPVERAIPRWVVGVVLVAVILGLLGYRGYSDLQTQRNAVAKLSQTLESKQAAVKDAEKFVSQIGFAQAWHSPTPRYLACMRAVTAAFPDDGQTYCMSLTVREIPKPPPGSKKVVDIEALTGTLTGKTTDQRRAQVVLESLKRSPVFSEVKSLGSGDVGRGQQVSFSISFIYRPEKK